MTTGYIDMAHINSALAQLVAGSNRPLSEWHLDSLVQVTNALMHENIHVVPGVGPPRAAQGNYELLVDAFPRLSMRKVQVEAARAKTSAWLDESSQELKNAWRSEKLNPNRQLFEWADAQRRALWPEHS